MNAVGGGELVNMETAISLPRAAFCIVANAYLAYWAYRAFVPRRRTVESAEPSARGEGSEYARRRRRMLTGWLVGALALLAVSRVVGPGGYQALMEWILSWMVLVPSLKAKVVLFGLWFVGLIVALVGALRETSGWLKDGEGRHITASSA